MRFGLTVALPRGSWVVNANMHSLWWVEFANVVFFSPIETTRVQVLGRFEFFDFISEGLGNLLYRFSVRYLTRRGRRSLP